MNFFLTIAEIVLFFLVIAYFNLFTLFRCNYFWMDERERLLDDIDGNIEKKGETFLAIMNNLDEKNSDLMKNFCKKRNTFQKIPWIVFSFNSFIQFLMFIFILIVRGRINRKSDYGFPQTNRNQSAQNRIIYNTYSRKKTKKMRGKNTRKENSDIDSENLDIKDKKKNKKRKGSKKQKY